MKLNFDKQKFLNWYVKEGKSLPTIAEKLGINVDQAYNIREDLEVEIMDFKAKEYDKVIQKYGLTKLNQFKYHAELYKKLSAELNKRDFTGLPTDKLYYILNHVQEKIDDSVKFMQELDLDDFDDFGYSDDYLEED